MVSPPRATGAASPNQATRATPIDGRSTARITSAAAYPPREAGAAALARRPESRIAPLVRAPRDGDGLARAVEVPGELGRVGMAGAAQLTREQVGAAGGEHRRRLHDRGRRDAHALRRSPGGHWDA